MFPDMILTLDRFILAKKLPVSERYPSGAINFDSILVELSDFNNFSGFIPFGGVWVSLILNQHKVANL